MYERLKLHDFTLFEDAAFSFVPGINAYAGANGTGKTHVLKLLYALQKHQYLLPDPARKESLDRTLVSVFRPDTLGRLVRRRRGVRVATVEARWNGRNLSFELNSGAKQLDVPQHWTVRSAPVFIPAKDVLGHSVRFLEAYESGWLDFDVTYRDLLVAAVPDVTRGPVPHAQQPLLESLRKVMSGRVEKSKEGRFYLKEPAGKIEFPLVAEGWRKLGLLWTLIRNGSLTSGNVLYWDEPEANLNPSMFPMVAEILATLAHSGTQLHVATHSYAMLRELEFAVKAAKTTLCIFALKREKDGSATVRPFEKFVDLEPNPILDEYDPIYRLSVSAALAND